MSIRREVRGYLRGPTRSSSERPPPAEHRRDLKQPERHEIVAARPLEGASTAEQERNALAANLSLAKVISGFIPICANCRRIRDAEGEWNAVESYIASRTGAEFTHGICPACAEQLYGSRRRPP